MSKNDLRLSILFKTQLENMNSKDKDNIALISSRYGLDCNSTDYSMVLKRLEMEIEKQ